VGSGNLVMTDGSRRQSAVGVSFHGERMKSFIEVYVLLTVYLGSVLVNNQLVFQLNQPTRCINFSSLLLV
jgi:hypothetical protein